MKIETKRLNIRLAKKEDIGEIINFFKRNDDHLSPWSPEQPKNFYDREFWFDCIQQYQKEFEKDLSLRMCLFNKTGQLIGRCNFTNFERGPFQNCRLGYMIDQEYEGQGIMSEALRALIPYVFNELKLHRIEANAIVGNTRSRKLLEKLGFTEHGVSKKYLKIDGKWQDHVLTSLIAE